MKILKCIALAIFLLIPIAGFAQQVHQPWRHQFDLEAGLKIPSGDLQDHLLIKNGMGIGLTYYIQILSDRHFFLSAGVGYDWFDTDLGGAQQIQSETKVDIIPFNIGVRYNFRLTGIQPYVGLELGMWRFHVTSDIPQLGEKSSTTFAFTPIPKVGVRIPLVPQVDFDANIKYGYSFYKADSQTESEPYQQLELNIGVAYTIGSDNYKPM